MKAATIKEIKYELGTLSKEEVINLCLVLMRFKKENKELLTYHLFEKTDEAAYIQSVKREIDLQFQQINRSSYFFIKKSVRKILRLTKKYIRYSKKKETEIELLLYVCAILNDFNPSLKGDTSFYNIYKRQIALIKKALFQVHDDLQYDYQIELDKLT